MSISVGDRLPEAIFLEKGVEGIAAVTGASLFAGRRVVLFGVPGAYTGTCSTRHVPSFIRVADARRAKGIDEIACVSVNDPFVMSAWNERDGSSDITMIADGNGEFTEALGLSFDGSKFGMGKRSQRYSMIVNDGTVEQVNVEAPGDYRVSGAEAMLEQL